MIAETTDLGTRFAKMAVTDERGRYVMPDLPKAKLQGVGARLWPRRLAEGRCASRASILDLTAEVAPSLAAAARYYPAAYWYSMVKIPDQSLFPGTGDKGNGIPEMFKTQDQWLNFIKTNGCGNCHQMGNYATRTHPGESRQVRVVAGRLGLSALGRPRRPRHGALHHPADDAGWRPARPARRLDRPDQSRRTARAAARRGRSASSAISSSPCATGSTRSTTCTI